jgi:hypothetical protein
VSRFGIHSGRLFVYWQRKELLYDRDEWRKVRKEGRIRIYFLHHTIDTNYQFESMAPVLIADIVTRAYTRSRDTCPLNVT